MSDFLKKVGNKVRFIRKAKGLTQEDLAEKCGLQYTYIGGIERGERNVSLQTIEKLAEGLAVPPYELLKPNDINNEEIFKENIKIVEIYQDLLLKSEKDLKSLLKINREIVGLLEAQKKQDI
ncbi:helix-turn-helix domain-containing protein [Neobacillus vireti]|uniref:helix-turn-helix domain-containing protein n=1 Tax=Neobacillus vireti TaxID=220686 RepID=UPI0030001A4E